jgi:DNA topoisomerase-3
MEENALSKSEYKLVIAEKPSVAKSLAAVLGADTRKDGFLEGGGYLVSWCFGHLVELAPPAAYGQQYKRWSRDVLPILPEKWKHEASADKKKQLDTLRGLMARSDVNTVINACDAGREGELIFRLVYEYCGCKKPMQRLWISSMENAAIQEGFASLRDGAEYNNLYTASLCRTRADWIVGMNATRLFSCLYGATLNVGRVQSPTLAMVVEREAAVRAFVSQPFYTPVIDTGGFTASGEKLNTLEEADAVRSACDSMDATVLSVEKKEKREAAPKLYDLTTLQRDANRLLGYTAKQTLDLAQSLYEKKLITYPRTDSRYLTEDMLEGLPGLVELTVSCLPFGTKLAQPDMALVINNARVSDHHAIIPTLEACRTNLSELPTVERNILIMLMVRLACAVDEAHRFEAVTASLECGGYAFTAKGKTVLQEGWKVMDSAFHISLKEKPESDDDVEDNAKLPDLSDGQVFSSVAATVREGKTSPPKRFTEDTLLAAMESVGADDMPEEAERKGMGTPATRAGVIEKLIRSGSMERKKKLLVPTEKGINLITILPEDLKSPLLTAEWEQKLKQVERGELDNTEFMNGIAALTGGIVTAHDAPLPAFASVFAPSPKGAVIGKCSRCGADVVEAAKGFFCSSRACRFALWKDSRFWSVKGKKLDKKTAGALLTEGRVFFSDLISGRTGKAYAAAILLEDDGQRAHYKLEFENERKSA